MDNEESKLIDEEFTIWRKNIPFLYDLFINHTLKWTSLTCQWLPEKVIMNGYSEQKLILGTHTYDAGDNQLMIAKVRMPLDDHESDAKANHEKQQTNNQQNANKSKVEIVQMIKHKGEVNRARYMPQDQTVIATRSYLPEIFIYTLKEFPKSSNSTPQLTLSGHSQEGYGLSWNVFKSGYLLSSSEDSQICLWDISGNTTNGHQTVKPFISFSGHSKPVQDVAWHLHHDCLFGSVADDHFLNLWDIRKGEGATARIAAHNAEINSINFSPFSEFHFLTASADKSIGLWDMRRLNDKLVSFTGHKEEVFQVMWNPIHQSIFASAGADRRVNVWDISRIGEAQSADDALDGPPELLFTHGGHTNKVSEIDWNLNNPMVIASTADHNLQIWQMAEHNYSNDFDDAEK